MAACPPIPLALPTQGPNSLQQLSALALLRRFVRCVFARGSVRTQAPRCFPQVQVPMLMVWGDEDQITPLRTGYGPYFTEKVPCASLREKHACSGMSSSSISSLCVHA